MKKYFWFFAIFLAFVFIFFPSGAFATENIDYKQLYQDAISDGALNTDTKSYDEFVKENEEEFIPVYDEGLKEKVFEESLSYTEWLKLNNYGQPPGEVESDNGEVFEDITDEVLGSTENIGEIEPFASYQGKAIKSGDNQTIAKRVAKFADRSFYSTSGSSKQNGFLDYKITDKLYQKNPTYCSKLVYQAYYYGSGNIPVVKVRRNGKGMVLPYALIAEFNKSFKPIKVAEFKG
ncbi:hypothetical protein J14TS2_42120 [Bacillus sp. J14TS2]|uniref:hypothetical protein n=1 Tax=Bacillus sp. J14TS2 TaxID=2807188 RepID=UPI001B155AA4|nr:hypothetical protein [Bacillus sp. J14TS2]GIN73737.1 hypothetical protein J14TS2_42120 [Bacillus sp. J14TS2]